MTRSQTCGAGNACHRTTKMVSGIARLQPVGERHRDARARNHAELALPGDRTGQLPPGYGDAHAALDDRGEVHCVT